MNVEPEKRPTITDIKNDKLWESYGEFNKIRELDLTINNVYARSFLCAAPDFHLNAPQSYAKIE